MTKLLRLRPTNEQVPSIIEALAAPHWLIEHPLVAACGLVLEPHTNVGYSHPEFNDSGDIHLVDFRGYRHPAAAGIHTLSYLCTGQELNEDPPTNQELPIVFAQVILPLAAHFWTTDAVQLADYATVLQIPEGRHGILELVTHLLDIFERLNEQQIILDKTVSFQAKIALQYWYTQKRMPKTIAELL